jgi:hypothetical protein
MLSFCSLIILSSSKFLMIMKYPIALALTFFVNALFAQNNLILPVKLKTTNTLVTPAGTTAQANGIKSGTILVTVDTSIRVNPKYAYLSVEFTNLTGTVQAEIVEGINTFWVFDKAGKEIIIKEKFLKKISAAMGESSSNMLIKIPFRLKTDKNIYTIHYRWENKDKRKNLDLLTMK